MDRAPPNDDLKAVAMGLQLQSLLKIPPIIKCVDPVATTPPTARQENVDGIGHFIF